MRRLALIAAIAALCAPTAGADSHGETAVVPLSAKDGGPRRWQVIGDAPIAVRATAAPDAEIVARAQGGTIFSNLGCAAGKAHVWCEVETVHGQMRGFAPAKDLEPAKGPDGTVPMGLDDSAARARKGDFDARTQIPCAQEQGEPMGACAAFVARGTGGDATVVVRFANGFRRSLYFTHGVFVAANATMSGNGTDTDWQRMGARHLIRVDDQQYDLRDDFIIGG